MRFSGLPEAPPETDFRPDGNRNSENPALPAGRAGGRAIKNGTGFAGETREIRMRIFVWIYSGYDLPTENVSDAVLRDRTKLAR